MFCLAKVSQFDFKKGLQNIIYRQIDFIHFGEKSSHPTNFCDVCSPAIGLIV